MVEAKQLLPGFNHNVRHQGKLYHVQTEDSGTGNPQVTSHVFLGGNVLAARKTSYAELLGSEDLAARVRKVMEDQHKALLREVVRGAFDAVEQERTATARAYEPGELAPGPAAEPVQEPEPQPEPEPEPEPQPAFAEAVALASNGAAAAKEGPWGPPVLPRVQKPALAAPPACPVPPARAARPSQPLGRVAVASHADASRPSAADAADRRLDELILSYLAEDLGTKRER
jgi:hypothetical protein